MTLIEMRKKKRHLQALSAVKRRSAGIIRTVTAMPVRSVWKEAMHASADRQNVQRFAVNVRGFKSVPIRSLYGDLFLRLYEIGLLYDSICGRMRKAKK